MSFSTNSGNVTVAGTITATSTFPVAEATQTIVTASSVIAGVAITAGTGILGYTVTAGKTFYLTSFIMNITGGTSDTEWSAELTDGGAGGTRMATIGYYGGIAISFPVPIPFSTNVWIDSAANGTARYTLIGFEQ